MVARTLAIGWVGLALSLACACSDDGGGDGGCPEPLATCGEACVDLRVDPGHCGACGHPCGEGEACVASTCTALRCDEGRTACDHACVDVATDATHCGACGNACSGGQVCSSGSCECPADTVACGDRCAELATDPEHCGACGNACTAGDRCLHGACTPAACEGTLLLPSLPEVSLGGAIRDLEVLDWDGDGVLDLVGARHVPAELVVRAGRGDGTFEAAFPLEGVPSGLFAAGDLDGDGDRDIAVHDPFAREGIAVGLQADDGSFAVTRYPWTDTWINALTIADLDGDGLPEVVGVAPNELRVLRNEGGGSFAYFETTYGVSNAQDLRVGDLDGDGDLDLAVLNPLSLHLLRNDGDFRLASFSTPIVAWAENFELADLDGDGDLDVVTSRGELLRNRGDFTFEAWIALQLDLTRVETADLNRDGRLDLAFVDGDYRLSVYLGTAEGFDGPETSVLGFGMSDVFLGDLDGDGVVEAVSVDREGTVAIQDGPGDGTFPTHVGVASDAGAGPSLAAAYFEPDDGVLDLVLATQSIEELHVAYVVGDEVRLEAGRMALDHVVDDVALGDVDGDGRVDVLVTDRAGDSLTLVPSPPDGWLERIGIPAGDGPMRLALTDIDRDGWLDIAVLDADGRELRVLRNHAWADPVTAALLDEPRDLATGDADGDGAPDFAIAGAGWLQLVRSDGEGRLPTTAAVAVDAWRVEVADLDGDGRDEVIALAADAIHVLRAVGTGLEEIFDLPYVDGRALRTVDLDRDGWTDVLVLDRRGRLELFRGGADGGLTSAGRWAATGAECYAVGDCDLTLADADGDGRVEVFVAVADEVDWVVPGCRGP